MSSSRSYFPEAAQSGPSKGIPVPRRESNSQSTSSSSRKSSTASIDQPKAQKKTVLGFLTLKEPSASALQDFAAQQRKIGKATSSSQKLPSHVPAVNSRWNGLPEMDQRPHSSASASRPSFLRRTSNVPALDSDHSISPPSSRGQSPLTPPCEELSRTHLQDDVPDRRKASKPVTVRDNAEALPWEMYEPPPEQPSPKKHSEGKRRSKR